MMCVRRVPFEKDHELFTGLERSLEEEDSNHHEPNLKDPRLPGHPAKRLAATNTLTKFLLDDLVTAELDTMAPYLWMMTTPSSQNVNPLHFQKVRGREIVITEFPRLHLVWKHSQVFIKPLPRYLLSYAFWNRFLVEDPSPLGVDRQKLFQAAKGLLRTYYHLIKHETDFHTAQSARLLPQDITWQGFSNFINDASTIHDSEVSLRYGYGEIRLTRLNFYSRFFLQRTRYEWGQPQYSTYFNQFYGHILFVFAILSLLLNALQVELGAETLLARQWSAMWHIARYFSVLCIVSLGLITVSLAVILIIKVAREWIYTLRVARSKRKICV